MDWVKKHYDLAILGLATLLLVASAGWIAWNASRPSEDLAGVPTKPTPNDQFQKPDLSVIEKALAEASEPAKWQPDTTGAKGSLFVSRKYLLKDGKLLDPIEGGEMLHPPIPNAWFDENRLDLSNSRIKEIDSDGDGFSNLEEFEAKTKPNDKTSTPPSFTKLQLVAYKPMPLNVIFKNVNETGDGNTFSLKFGGKSEGVKINHPIEVNGTPYKIIGYNEKPKDIFFRPLQNNDVYKLDATPAPQYIRISIPQNHSRLLIKTAGLEDNCDVYVKNDEPPTVQDNLYKCTITGNDPTVAVDIPKSGNYFVRLDNLEGDYKLSFSAKTCVLNVQKLKNSTAQYTSLVVPNVEKFPDLSELKIENINTRETVVLVKNQQINDPASCGEFRNLLNNQLIKLKKGEEFTIPPDSAKFKVIDITSDSAQIEDLFSGKKHLIRKSTTPSP